MNLREIIDDLTAQHRALPAERRVARMYLKIAIGALRTAAKAMPKPVLLADVKAAAVEVGETARKVIEANAIDPKDYGRARDVPAPPPVPEFFPKHVRVDSGKRVRHCRFCGSIEHDARSCPTPSCGDPTSSAIEPCAVAGCRFHARSRPHVGDVPPEAPPAADDEEPEPADEAPFVYPSRETLKTQESELERGRRLAVVYERPAISSGRCTNEVRPCPWAGCQHNLAIWDVTNIGTIRYMHPGKTLEELDETCVLDVVAAHPDGVTLEEVGRIVGLTRERVRQVEVEALWNGKEIADIVAA